ncbi:MAG TPA: hypothetical protein VE978_19290 [Chitinophagales bacterium]|nr:hypothetical protein [Chitinophagales bacterium]
MKERIKKLLEEYFAEHPHVNPGKKKKSELTSEERQERDNSRRQQRDKARNKRQW